MRATRVLCFRSCRDFQFGAPGMLGVLGLIHLMVLHCPVQAANHYLSDLTPVSAINGWGDFERDQSNGELSSHDGRRLSINGTRYRKGLGVHADSRLAYRLNRNCQSFTSDIGIDDEVGNRGSVIFQVVGDGRVLYQSGVLRGSAAPQSINADLTGVDLLELVVSRANDGIAFDHANWAGAQVSCTASPGEPAQQAPTPPAQPMPTPTPQPEPTTPSAPAPPPASPSPAQLRDSQPVVARGQRTVTISGVRISNPRGTCIDIEDAETVTIENSEIGPCGEAGMDIGKSRNVTIRNVYIHDTTDNGILLWSVTGATVTDNRIDNTQTAVSAARSTRINVSFNTFKNVRGPFPAGQFVQFNGVTGAGNRISCNVGENVSGQSYPEDAISLYESSGVSSDHIQVIGNKIKGGGPSDSGGGIMLGDGGGAYQTARDNILVDPGQYGIAVSGGNSMAIIGNRVYARRQSFTNVGIYIWNQYAGSCTGIRVESNLVNWTSSSGRAHAFWDGENCSISGLSSNNLNAAIDASIFNQPIAACQR